jgi:hypothetical protein
MAIQPGQRNKPAAKRNRSARFPTRAEVERKEAKQTGDSPPANDATQALSPATDAHEHDHGSHDHGGGHEHGAGNEHQHHTFDHFPTEEEVLQEEARQGFIAEADPDEASLRIERFLLEQLTKAFAPAAPESGLASILLASPERAESPLRNVTVSLADVARIVGPSIAVVLAAAQRRREDHRRLSASARTAFNAALQALHTDGSYQRLAAIHADMSHNMHSMGNPAGTQRFLPWHRIYTLQLENLLRAKNPALTIPYWNYAVDRARPDWVWKPPGVVRRVAGANGGALPSQSTVNNLINNVATYTPFTRGIEFDAHNQVHNWCNGTITSPSTAPRDPIFWLLHSNVDRMWDLWQARRTGVPSLSGANAIMDPWTQTATAANSALALGYSYA